MKIPYSMLIQWSDEDQVYVVTLPEFPINATHGDTYEEAAKNGREVLELLIEMYEEEGRPMPRPHKFDLADETSSALPRRPKVRRRKHA